MKLNDIVVAPTVRGIEDGENFDIECILKSEFTTYEKEYDGEKRTHTKMNYKGEDIRVPNGVIQGFQEAAKAGAVAVQVNKTGTGINTKYTITRMMPYNAGKVKE